MSDAKYFYEVIRTVSPSDDFERRGMLTEHSLAIALERLTMMPEALRSELKAEFGKTIQDFIRRLSMEAMEGREIPKDDLFWSRYTYADTMYQMLIYTSPKEIEADEQQKNKA